MIAVTDANVLLRLAKRTDPMYPVADAAVLNIQAAGDELRSVPQNYYEFWVVATRPLANNGLGLTTAEAFAEMLRLESMFPLIPDPPDLYDRWRSLVVAHDCKGKVAHDARLAAAMQARGLSYLLTFNGGDFARFPFVTVLDPAAVAARHP